MTNSNPFLTALEKFKSDFKYISDKEQDLVAIKSALVVELTQAAQFSSKQINEQHPLFKLATQLKASIYQGVLSWDAKLEEASPMRALSEQFADRVILLVFGKVNAGKSSFCNYLTNLFAPEQIKRFCFKDGKVKYFEGAFAEGVTETTAQIQGVELGSNLVLLDSPGLHSIVDENGDLTRRYTDSADAILWLTPSSSPGQVQELQDLKLELEKKKPLQPVITKSDVLVEDWCDEAQDLIQKVENKSAQVRQLQQEDVHSRVTALGGVDDLKEAVSVSVHAYKTLTATSENALQEAGLQTLFERLVVIVNEANQYKVVKAKRQMINFLDGEVLHSLNENVLPQVQELQQLLTKTTYNLRQKQNVMSSQILDNVLCEVPLIVDKHMNNRDKEAISRELNQLIEEQISNTLTQELSGYVNNIQRVSGDLSSGSLGDFDDITIDVKQVTGRRASSIASSAGGLGGAAAGFAVGGPIGALIGGAIGSFGGNKLGERIFVEISTHKEAVGVSPDQVILTTSAAVRQQLPQLVEHVFSDVQTSFMPLQQYADSIVIAIENCASKTQALKV
ncbi:dynamin family protein [Vibrio diabolicus]|uniref:dynamin family protein n=1 Tax=Vibrio diabolicus TaxID=50719 RepID=UPI00215CF986|nr:dynamin family protein [Vibrio diabolicus]MCR9303082.1 dynamin family protein [Vibrio diabolicus]MCR9424621.1 dynamin family protein [Vibrio diabolicus]MCS0365570.1 dynamin family protein [Vibrio diabolicus]